MRKKLLVLLVVLALGTVGTGWTSGVAARAATPASCPVETGLTITCGVVYGTDGGLTLTMDAYEPTTDLGTALPAVILIHGGGWIMGNSMSLASIAEQMAESGLAAFSINYTLDTPGHPAFPQAPDDAESAVSYLRAHPQQPKEWDIEPGEIGALGSSAGANLAGMLATCADQGAQCAGPQIQAAVLWSAPLDLAQIGCTSQATCPTGSAGSTIANYLGCYDTGSCQATYAAASPTNWVSAGAAPMLVWNSDNEAIAAAQLTDMVTDLHDDCANYRFTLLPGNQHASNYASIVMSQSVSFLKEELGAEPPSLGCDTSPPWTDAAMAYDPDANAGSGAVVAFGGCCTTGGAFLHTTRELTDGSWHTISPASTPPARLGAAMAWDPAIGKLVMFGGESGSTSSGYNTSLNDLWAFTGTNWTKVKTSGTPPSARSEAALAYDASTGGLVLYGGETALASGSASVALGDTWTLTGSTWTEVSAHNPTVPAVYGAAMATDPATGDPLLFGGDATPPGCDEGCLDLQNGTYEWAGGTWTAQSPASSPAPRMFAGLAAVTGASPGLVLYGGLTESSSGDTNTESLASDTWTWQNEQWTNAAPASHPPAADDAGLAGSPLPGYQAISSGGFTGADALVTTTYGWTGTVWVKNP